MSTRFRSLASTLAIVAMLGVLAGGAAGGATLHKKKGLSLTTVTIAGGFNTDPEGVEVPVVRGFFKQQGLTVNVLNISSGNADLITALLSGSVQFIQVGASTGLTEFQTGVPIRGIYSFTNGPAQEILMSATAAAAHGIPATGSTPAGALRQLMALKGSHLNIAVSTTVSESYLDLTGLAALHGLTVGTGGTSSDFNVVTTGSANNLATGLQAGKFDGIANSPPTTVISGYNGITIQLYRIAPLAGATWLAGMTTPTMIQQHPDVVQALVNGFVEGWNYSKIHQASAAKIANAYLSSVAITSPETQAFLDAEFAAHLGATPAITKAAVNDEVQVLKATNPSVNINFPVFAVNRFVDKAIDTFGYHYAK